MAKIHIGKKIEKVLEDSPISIIQFAAAIKRTRNVAYDILGRESISTDLLLSISKVLNHNFFSYYDEQLKKELKTKKK